MSIIKGVVRVKESNEPIPDLIVSIHTRASTSGATKIADPFKKFTHTLGSSITNLNGDFLIEFELPISESSSNETAPKRVARKTELMLAVLAPATTQSINTLASLPPDRRVLHYMTFDQLTENQTETVVIRLRQDQLREHDIAIPSENADVLVEKMASKLVTANLLNTRIQDTVREQLAPRRRERLQVSHDLSEQAKNFTSHLHMVPRALRTRNFVGRGENAGSAMHYAMEAGLVNLSGGARPSQRITLSEQEMETCGATRDRDSMVFEEGVNLDQTQLCALLNVRRGGPSLTYVRSLLDSLRDEETADEETEEDLEIPPSAELEPSEMVTQRILGQLVDLPIGAPVTEDAEPKPITMEQLNTILPSVSIGSGPTEVTAFHDFHHLQIAFEHVWTEAFDSDALEDVQEIYRKLVEFGDDYSLSEMDVLIPSVVGIAENMEIEDLKHFLKEVSTVINGTVEMIPPNVLFWFPNDITWDKWKYLSPTERNMLSDIAIQIDINDAAIKAEAAVTRAFSDEAIEQEYTNTLIRMENDKNSLIRHGKAFIQSAGNSDYYAARLFRLLRGVKKRLNEPYAFTHYAPNSANFGLLNTYRQTWEPGSYQVGDLVSTIPLAPGEKRKFSTKQVVKRSRAEMEMEKSISTKSKSVSGTRRADAEIVNKASLRTNFNMNTEGSFRFGFGEISTGTRFQMDQATESSSVKKDFREAVIKAAQEYKQERSVELKTSEEVTMETSTSGELGNPNNELSVTYLLYELERQYTVSERIHRVTPVILVAQEIPNPSDITESWLLTYDWIIRRIILDENLLPALDYVSDGFAGDEISITVRKANWEKQIEMVKELEGAVKRYRSSRDDLRGLLIDAQENLRRLEAAEESQKGGKILRAIFTGGLSEFAGTGPTPEQAGVAVKTLEERLKYLEGTLAESQEKLAEVHEGLNEATNQYTRSLQEQSNRRIAIDQLRIHVKENILYYMQAIWDHEPPDQRFFRLADVEIALPELPERTCRLRYATREEIESGIPLIEREGRTFILEGCDPPQLPINIESAPKKKLVEMADLDRPLGYKGNYTIFPLKTCLYLTNYMMHDFFDDYFGVRDPDIGGNFSVDELVEYTDRLLRDDSINLTERQRTALERIVLDRLQKPRRDKDLIVVPTGQLYMEALLGTNPLLETFKLAHRKIDAAKARAELRESELENLRRAARMLQEEPNLVDPIIDKLIKVEGASDIHLETET